MKQFYYTFLAIAFAVTSCKNNEAEKAQPDPRTIVPFTQQGATNLQTQTQQTPVAKTHNLFHEKNPVSATASSVVSGINPAHGQPNHRCDIPVGAPLNGSANNANATTTKTSAQPIQTITKVEKPKTITPKGMNPPHGELGHRCDIAVGAPLNSKPAEVPTTTTTATTEIVKAEETKEAAVPPLLSTNPLETVSPKEVNPK